MSNRTRNLHVWTTRTGDGRKRQVRAQLFGARWTLTSRCADEEDWCEHEPALLEDLEELEAVLFRKYQRNHLAWEHLVGVRELLRTRRLSRPSRPDRSGEE
jgi:hypothetical protein